jgi:hypothetical protein
MRLRHSVIVQAPIETAESACGPRFQRRHCYFSGNRSWVVGLYREAGRRGIDVEPVPNVGAGSISHSEEVADATEAATGDQCSAVW